MTLLLISAAVKLVAEIALAALLGQGVLGLLVGAQREHNVVYRLLQVLTDPFVRATRWLAPRRVPARQLPWLAGLLLACVWLLATLAKLRLCLVLGAQACR